MNKAHNLTVRLLIAINEERWFEASEIVVELQKVLNTYKECC